MNKPLLIAALALAVTSPAIANNTTPPGTCTVSYPQTAIPGDAAESVFGITMTIAAGRTGNWHKHDAVEYLTVTRGSGTLEIIGKPPVALSVGKTVMIPANAEHRIHDANASMPVSWSGIFVGPSAKSSKSSHTKLTEGETAWTPGCPH